MRPGSGRMRWAVVAVLVLAAGPALTTFVYILPRLALDLAFAVGVALCLGVVVILLSWLETLGVSGGVLRGPFPTFLRGKAARGEGAEPALYGPEQDTSGGGAEPRQVGWREK